MYYFSARGTPTRKLITLAQATLVAQRFGVRNEDITRDRKILSK
jgi:hypothetical protein